MRKAGRKILGTVSKRGPAGLAAGCLTLAVLVSGCTSIKDHRGYVIDQTLIDSVQPGVDNRQSVEKTLGRPSFVSQFGQQDWYYISQAVVTPAFHSPRTKSQEILRVRFDVAGNVVGIDKAGMEKVARINPEGDITPTLGLQRGLLQDLFGNIGSVGAAGMGSGQGGAPSGGGNGPNGS